MSTKKYDEDERAKIRSGLSNEQYAYVMTLEHIANAAYHVVKNTPHASKPTVLTVECLNDLSIALATVDFMEGDELRDSGE